MACQSASVLGGACRAVANVSRAEIWPEFKFTLGRAAPASRRSHGGDSSKAGLMYTFAHMRVMTLFWCAGLYLGVVFAQSVGTISGTVLDLPGKAVASAPIQARNVTTNTVYRTASSETGPSTLHQLPPGAYQCAGNRPEFSCYLQPNQAVA